MGIKLPRQKPKSRFLQIFYNLNKILPLSDKTKFKLFLNLEWVFDRFSHEYSFKNYTPDNHPVRLHTKKFLLSMLKPEHIVLDLGCNMGDMSIYMAEKAKYVVGIDYNEKAIGTAKEKYKRDNLEFHCLEAYEYLTKGEMKFDVLVLSHILEHLDDPDDFLEKFTPFFDFIYIELPDFDKTLLNHYRKDLGLPIVYTDADHINEFDRDDLAAIIEKRNIRIVFSEYRFGVQKLWCEVIK